MSLSDALLLDPYPFEIWIAYRTDGIKGSGTLNDPYDGSTTERFDAIMRSLPAMSRIHLGPGNFETEGYWDGRDAGSGWEIQPGMVITGAGMDATTLKLLPQADTDEHYFSSRSHPWSKGWRCSSLPLAQAKAGHCSTSIGARAGNRALSAGRRKLDCCGRGVRTAPRGPSAKTGGLGTARPTR